MGRQPCCAKVGLKRGPWTIEEDHRLMTFIINNGIQCWRTVPKLAGLLRCGKSCRLRWINYLRPDLKRGELSEFEENQIIQLHARLGNRWSKIASHFPGRTDNEIKNHWNTRIKKRLRMLGVDPVTHKPIEQQQCVKEETMQFEQTSNSISGEEHKQLQITPSVTSELEVFPVAGSKGSSCNDAMNLWQGYEMLLGSRNEEPVMHSESAPSSDNSVSFSIDDSLNYSIGESSPLQQDSQNWLHSVDSFLSWDGFNPFEDFLGFGSHH